MITRIGFSNFRGFKSMLLENLNQITLLSGKNNVGKSSVLEGVFLLLDHANPQSFAKINSFRGNNTLPHTIGIWEAVFYQMDSSVPLTIDAVLDDKTVSLQYDRDYSFVPNDPNLLPDIMNQFVSAAKESYTLRFRYEKEEYKEEGHFAISQTGFFRNLTTSNKNNYIEQQPHTQYINNLVATTDLAIVEWLGKMELSGEKQLVIDALQTIEPLISDIFTIAINGTVQLYGRIGTKMMPLKLLGDGVNRLLYIVLSMIGNPNSIILIDEIETGFHYSLHGKIWEVLARTARRCNCQIIASTHSYECIVGAIEGIKAAQAEESFCYYRLDKSELSHLAFRFDYSLLSKATDSEMEVR